MNLPKNSFKRALKRREQTLFGLWLGLADSVATEISADAGFDWLLIDNEHAPIELPQIIAQLQTLAAYPTTAIVRPVGHDALILKKLVDVGVQNFLIPMVETLKDVKKITDALFYQPLGRRGVGTSLARAARWNNFNDYLARANDEICLLIQLETVRGMSNLKKLLADDTDELLSGIFIGSADLAADMGLLGQPEHADVVAAVSDAVQQIASAGKAAGVLVTNPDLIEHYKKQGANFIGVGSDTMILARGTRELATKYRR